MLNIMRKLGTALKMKIGKSQILDEENSEEEEDDQSKDLSITAKAKSTPMIGLFKTQKFGSPKDQSEPQNAGTGEMGVGLASHKQKTEFATKDVVMRDGRTVRA